MRTAGPGQPSGHPKSASAQDSRVWSQTVNHLRQSFANEAVSSYVVVLISGEKAYFRVERKHDLLRVVMTYEDYPSYTLDLADLQKMEASSSLTMEGRS